MSPLRMTAMFVLVFVCGWLISPQIWKAVANLNQAGESMKQATTNSASAHFDKGVDALNANDWDGAIGWFDKALILDNEHAASYIHRGIAYDHKKDAEHARADFNEGIRLNPQAGDGYYYRGLFYKNQKKYDQALEDFTRAISLDPKKSEYYIERGHVYLDKNDSARALADVSQAVQLEPDQPSGYFARGVVYEKLKNYDKAIADFARAVQSDSRDPRAYNGLAWIYATCPRKALRNGPRALEYARYICQLTDWKEAFYFDTLAAAYAECGQFSEAIEWQKKAVAAPDAFDDEEDRQDARKRLKLYEAHQAFTDN